MEKPVLRVSLLLQLKLLNPLPRLLNPLIDLLSIRPLSDTRRAFTTSLTADNACNMFGPVYGGGTLGGEVLFGLFVSLETLSIITCPERRQKGEAEKKEQDKPQQHNTHAQLSPLSHSR